MEIGDWRSKLIGEGTSYYREETNQQIMYLFELWSGKETMASLYLIDGGLLLITFGFLLPLYLLIFIGFGLMLFGYYFFEYNSGRKDILRFCNNFVVEDRYSDESKAFDEKIGYKHIWDYDTAYVIKNIEEKRLKCFMYVCNKLYGSKYRIFEWLNENGPYQRNRRKKLEKKKKLKFEAIENGKS